MHKYIRTFSFTDEEWVRIKRLAAIKGFKSVAGCLDHIVQEYIEKNYDEKYDQVFGEEK